ncbi:tetraspanin-2 isoform X3 [Ursus maritimus]|uniref:Tetraspanin-2 isoform X3 n=1 Tax=Ursus maritimus TaxID=29073 RepID=A0A8M1FLA7_URSMA|nr:tetraspanin-2 isoform X3 [Ursus maritimus]
MGRFRGGLRCIKYLLLGFNLLFWLAGSAVIGFGLWFRFGGTMKDFSSEDKSPEYFYMVVYEGDIITSEETSQGSEVTAPCDGPLHGLRQPWSTWGAWGEAGSCAGPLLPPVPRRAPSAPWDGRSAQAPSEPCKGLLTALLPPLASDLPTAGPPEESSRSSEDTSRGKEKQTYYNMGGSKDCPHFTKS